MLEDLSNFTMLFSNSDNLYVKVNAFNLLVNDISDKLDMVQFAQIRGLQNRLSRLLNITVTSSNTSTDNEDLWFADWKSLLDKLE